MAWWKRDRPVMSYQSIGTDGDVHSVVTSPSKPDGWDTMVADMAADARRRRAALVVAEQRRAEYAAEYYAHMMIAEKRIQPGSGTSYNAASAHAQLALVYLTAWQGGIPPVQAPQTADAPAPDHEKHTQQEQK